MKAPKLFLVMILVGCALMLFSLFMPWFMTGASMWSEEQASELTRSTVKLHDLVHERSDAHAGHEHADGSFHQHDELPDDPKINAELEHFLESRNQLGKAIATREKLPSYLRILGACFALIGGIGWFAPRMQ